jgi:hypothetical protein
MLKGFVLGFFCFILFLFLHVVIFHTREIRHRFLSLAGIFSSLLPVYILLYILVPTEAMLIMPADPRVTPGVVIGIARAFNFILGILIYLLLFFGYCQFYFIIDRSISVRIMIELEKSEDKKLTLEQIKNVYSPDYLLLRRLGHMIRSKYIIEDSGFYRNLGKGRIVARVFAFLKGYLRIGEGG